MNQNKLLVSLLSFLCLSLISTGQSSFVHFSYHAASEGKILESITARYKKDTATLDKENKSYVAGIYKERYELIKKRVQEKEVLTDPQAQEYLNALAEEIFKNNPTLRSSDFRIVFSRTYLPNASSMGEGTIFFNIGLFHRLQNESQAAFVLCHEIAHYLLDHSNQNIKQYVNTVYSEAFQQELKTIRKSEFAQNNRLEKLSTGLLFKSRRHGRAFEQSADSMAIELLKNTRYDLREAMGCLALLDSVDRGKYDTNLDLSRVFHFPLFPFKKRWLQSEDLIFAISKEEKEKNQIEKDSLKTHPDCSVRSQRITGSVNSYYKPEARKFLVNEKAFYELKAGFDYESIQYSFENNNISRCLFLSLQMLQFQPENSYLQTMAGKSLNKIFLHQKNHELNKIVDLPGPLFDSSYNDLLQLIQNLRLSEIAAIAYHFMQQYEEQSSGDKDFVATLHTSRENFEKQ
jgi:predicted Zn-dependent protease